MIEAFNVPLDEADLSQPGYVASNLGVVEPHLLCDVRDPHRLAS